MNDDIEAVDSLLSFSTEGYVIENINYIERVHARLNFNEEDTTKSVVDYISKQLKWVNRGQEEQLAHQSWKYMSRMIAEGAYYLINGLHAKSLFYRALDCNEVLGTYSFKVKVCGVDGMDFTQKAQSGLTWVDAGLLKNSVQSNSFQQLLTSLSTDEVTLGEFLWNTEKSTFASNLVDIAKKVSAYYKCQNANKCSSSELFTVQWG